MCRVYLVFIILLFFSRLESFGQTEPVPNPGDYSKAVDILPPTPNASAMIKHNEITVSKNTGVASINVPIFELKGRKLGAGVGLSYASAGIKVDEIASQVGIGWSLQAGGVVTRTVRGVPDESNTRISAPAAGIGIDSQSYHFLYRIGHSISLSGNYDSEPDLFNFSFGSWSGSFVFDSAMHIVLIHASPLKIVFDSLGTAWNFKITDPQGIVYYFGGTGATEKTKKDQTCGKLFDSYVPVSWHLIQIQHPNGEAIFFNYTPLEYIYDTGLAQTMFYGSQGIAIGGGGSCNQTCVVPAFIDCEHKLHTQGVLLDNILLPGNSKLTFTYASRQDYQYGKLVSRISLYNLVNNSNTLVSFWDLNYLQQTANTSYNHRSEVYTNYTPYLLSAIQKSADSTVSLPYYFVYNDPGGRPCRLSYSQDHWGYFNGVNNQTLIPIPSDPQTIPWFPLATANREPNFTYAVKGMLSKVVYPTGGIDSLVYEPNVASSIGTSTYAVKHFFNGSSTGTSFQTSVTTSYSIQSNGSQYINLSRQCIDNSQTGDYDPLHNKCTFEILDPNNVSIYFPPAMSPATNLQEFVPLTGAGTFTLRITANGSVATAIASFSFYPQNIPSNYIVNKTAPGLRIREILTSNPNEKAMMKRYYYGALGSLDQSSLLGVDQPLYVIPGATRMFCQLGFLGTSYIYEFCQYTANYSSTQGNLYDFLGSPTSYATVVESLGGDNFEKGGIQSKFLAGTDVAGQNLYGATMYNAPKTNSSSFFNGKVKEEMAFMMSGGQVVPVTKKNYTYKIDSRLGPTVKGYSVNPKYLNNVTPDWNCHVGNDTVGAVCGYDIDNYLAAFDVTRYDVMSSWVYNDTVTAYTYSNNGVLADTTRFYYDNTSNLQLSRTETYDSKGNLLKTFFKYPHDYAGQAVYDNMIAKNIVAPVVDVEKDKGNSNIRLLETRTNFADWGNGNFQPSSFQTAYSSGVLKDVGTITKYDGAGNILEFKGVDGIVNAVIWGFGNLYPVARIYGAGYDQARAQLQVDTSALNTLSGTALLNQLNVLRQQLPAAQITTYDYQPQTGVLSMTDMNNRAAYYDYDSFRRLMDAKDKDGNMVKQITYHFAGTSPDNTFTIYMNQQRTRTAVPACMVGYTAGTYTYIVTAGKYFSTVSVAAANAMADAEMDHYAQDAANQNAVCNGPAGN